MKAPDFRRYVPALLVLIPLAAAAGWFARGIAAQPPGGVATVTTVQDEGVLFISDSHVFLIARGHDVLALSDDAQHLGEPVIYCDSSRMFESPAHGEKFDIWGRYYGGPASSDMDRVRSWIHDGVVYVDPNKVIATPDRSRDALEPAGPFCVSV